MRDYSHLDEIPKVDVEVRSHKSGRYCEMDAVWNEVLSKNNNITLQQIQDGIGCGWYYLNHKGKVKIVINEYNQHLWNNGGR